MLSAEPNAFDNLVVDVKRLFEEFPYDKKDQPCQPTPGWVHPRLQRIYRWRLIPLRHRLAFWLWCRNTHADLTWFVQFRAYWSGVLRGRGLWGVHDFFFLKNVYAMASAAGRLSATQVAGLSVPDNEHLRKWQEPLVISKLFHLVNKESFSHKLAPLLKMLKYHPRAESVLEFGCATAPITVTYHDFFKPAPGLHWTLADIEYLAFHYGCYRFRHCHHVHPLLLKHEEDFRLITPQTFDVIFCMAVFEHLPTPLRTIGEFHDRLNPGGLVIFDYVMSSMTPDNASNQGLDHCEGHAQRNQVLDFMERHFTVLEGFLHRDQTIHSCVLRKK